MLYLSDRGGSVASDGELRLSVLQRALCPLGAARTVEAQPVEETYAWVAQVTLPSLPSHPGLRLALHGLGNNIIVASGL